MNIFDLSGPLTSNMWYYGEPYKPFNMSRIATLPKNGYIASELQLTTHTGTHIECGKHWWEEGQSVDQIDLQKFIGPARVLRLPEKGKPLSSITAEDLEMSGGHLLEPGDICILFTGWDKYWTDSKYTTESPFLTIDAAQYLVDKQIRLFASDFAMCGDPRDGIDFVPPNMELPDYILLRSNIPYILGLTGVDKIPDQVTFCGFPLRLADGDGSPIRAVAWTS